MTSHTCPACLSKAMTVFHRQSDVPTNSCILLDTPVAAKSWPRGQIELGFCRECGFISNLAFDPRLTEYSGRYEETQAYSDTFNRFHRALAERLIKDHGLRGKRILEIGCGKGEFLKMLCEMGGNSGLGFDPSFRSDRLKTAQRIEFVQDFYGEKYAHLSADFICCKMTLEHIWDVGSFIAGVRRAVGDNDTTVFFQVPEASRILRACAFEDIYYEHCSYFTPASLTRLFRGNAFEVLDVTTEYEGQYLTIEARPAPLGDHTTAPVPDDEIASLAAQVVDFPRRLETKLGYWRGLLEQAHKAGQRVALWGSGSKAVAFLGSTEGGSTISFVVDINPHRQGHFMAGTGHPIVGPDELPKLRPDLVIVMNPVYRDEVIGALHRLDLDPPVLSL